MPASFCTTEFGGGAGRVLGSLGFLEVSVVVEREQGLAMTNDSSTTNFQQSADINLLPFL